jgi:hypothetical protein
LFSFSFPSTVFVTEIHASGTAVNIQ